jgi:hypothetical protein
MLSTLQGKREFYGSEGYQTLCPCSSSKVKLEASWSVVAETHSAEKCAMLGYLAKAGN